MHHRESEDMHRTREAAGAVASCACEEIVRHSDVYITPPLPPALPQSKPLPNSFPSQNYNDISPRTITQRAIMPPSVDTATIQWLPAIPEANLALVRAFEPTLPTHPNLLNAAGRPSSCGTSRRARTPCLSLSCTTIHHRVRQLQGTVCRMFLQPPWKKTQRKELISDAVGRVFYVSMVDKSGIAVPNRREAPSDDNGHDWHAGDHVWRGAWKRSWCQ
ncbi:hypothetical protein K458DRAFT_47266 [Lentithecium fluviatile CBS 122367]|uniref:Uncharacterized protein n=1 Tax=Lentithecium fluviatile CBS 122367 TaxID=1168545 RepID=A0A6G1IZ26_9PLEO|nr:hypothetical protein K458DRAFT_47266 [Lentithecium fluviatile CBS 122367]